MARVLVVDDEVQMLRTLAINLRARKYETDVAIDAAGALRTAADRAPDVVLLDLGLPDMDGLRVIEGLRGWTNVPILVLSGRTDRTDKIEALDAGADDYMTKPFAIDELFARIRAITRRASHTESATIATVGEYAIDLVNHSSQPPVHLTKTEWRLLEILLRNPGKLITQRDLLRQVWGSAYSTETHYLRQYVGQLRRKLEPVPSRPRHLLTEPGMGYRYQPGP
jgi:two-component system, OmpR family, KDP operon response regulator KdpE